MPAFRTLLRLSCFDSKLDEDELRKGAYRLLRTVVAGLDQRLQRQAGHGVSTPEPPVARAGAKSGSWDECLSAWKERNSDLSAETHFSMQCLAIPAGLCRGTRRAESRACHPGTGRRLGQPPSLHREEGQEVWRFKAREADRRHVEDSIREGRHDIDCSTERKNSPHVLVCTKNQASYERRVAQRRADLEDLTRLKA